MTRIFGLGAAPRDFERSRDVEVQARGPKGPAESSLPVSGVAQGVDRILGIPGAD